MPALFLDEWSIRARGGKVSPRTWRVADASVKQRQDQRHHARARSIMTFSAVLLAGGESRRLGNDKAQVIFEGEPLWQRQLRLLRNLQPEQVVVSARIEPKWRPREVAAILDDAPSRGPMSGICAALSRMKTSHLLVLAVDMPFILENDLHKLVSFVRTGCGVVPIANGIAEPLLAIYPAESLDIFKGALSRQNTSLQPIVCELGELQMVRYLYLSREEAERCRSINTPTDLVQFVTC
jgi:molybdenum cofactor guanylyltransferase